MALSIIVTWSFYNRDDIKVWVAYCNSVGLKNSTLVHHFAALYSDLTLYSDRHRDFLFFVCKSRQFQRAQVPIGCSTLCFLAPGDVAMSWLAVETSDVPYALKLTSGGTVVAQSVERASHVQRLCPRCRSQGFDSTLWPFAACHSLFPLFPVHSSAVLSK